ncbi:MAG: LPS export ABC transporter permease LptG [Sphingomonadales bacterium]
MIKVGQSTLYSYIAKIYAVRFLVVFIGLALVLQALDLLASSGDVLEPEGAGMGSLWRYTLLRLPQIATELPPFTALLATLMTFAALAQHSEIIVMLSSGLSAYRIVLPLVLASAVIAAGHFLFNETVLVDANIELDDWKRADYAVTKQPEGTPAAIAWAIDGDTLIRVGAVTRGGTILDQVTLYDRNEDAKLVETTSANFAAYVKGAWTMFDVTRFTLADHAIAHEPMLPWETKLPPERFLALAVQPSKVSFVELWKTTQELAAEGQRVMMLQSWLNQKIAGPAASMLMPLLGVLAGFGVMRSGLMFIRIAIGMALGFSFFVVDNLLLAFGEFGTLPPVLAAWAPIVLFLLIGLTVVIYAEE